ncbi:MAG: T9SS type A sorting domain-containing protein, partial [Paludibacteraceae bacterium]
QPTQTGFYVGSDLESIFPNKHIQISDSIYKVNPVFDGISYKWSTGETTKEISLNRSGYPANVENFVTLDMNFRGHIFSDTLYFKFVTAGVKKWLTNKEIQLMKNPVEEYLPLKLNISGSFDMQIFNALGQLCLRQAVITSGNETRNFNVANLNKGVYILNLTNSNQLYTVQFIKK